MLQWTRRRLAARDDAGFVFIWFGGGHDDLPEPTGPIFRGYRRVVCCTIAAVFVVCSIYYFAHLFS